MFKGFEYNAIARDLVMKRTLKNGKSLQFIYTGHTKAEYHTPGNAILGNTDGAPRWLRRPSRLTSSSSALHSCMNLMKFCHITICALRSAKIGYALAQKYDRLIFRSLTRGARQASPISKTGFVEPGGTQIRVGSTANASDAYNAINLVAAFYDAAASLDEKGVSSRAALPSSTPVSTTS